MNNLSKITQIKQALDSLPMGISYFNKHGLLVFCNEAMYMLSYDLLQGELQHLNEFIDCINEMYINRWGDVCYLEDSKHITWKVSVTSVDNIANGPYTQITAFVIQDLIDAKREYEVSIKELKETQARLESMRRELIDVTRQEEILNMKISLHDRIGRGIIESQAALASGDELGDDVLDPWYKAIRLLKGYKPEDNTNRSMDDLIEAIEGIGIECVIQGCIDEDDPRFLLLQLCMRECSTNAYKYANAAHMYITIQYKGGICLITITNDGVQPSQEIVLGGGLKGVKQKMENAGGVFEVVSHPRFELRVSLP